MRAMSSSYALQVCAYAQSKRSRVQGISIPKLMFWACVKSRAAASQYREWKPARFDFYRGFLGM